MNKRIIIVHGWTGSSTSDFFPWAKDELEKMGYGVITPDMPDTDHPVIEKWVSYLGEVIGQPQSTDILIGHSVGVSAILRYLEGLSENAKVKKVIMVAPWAVSLSNLDDDEDEEIVKPWLETPINLDQVKNKADSFVAIFSDNDPYVPLDNQDDFREKLGSEIVIEHNMGHFSESEGVKKLPVLLKFI